MWAGAGRGGIGTQAWQQSPSLTMSRGSGRRCTSFHGFSYLGKPSHVKKHLGGRTPVCWGLRSALDRVAFCANRPCCGCNIPTEGGTGLESVSPRPPFLLYWWERVWPISSRWVTQEACEGFQGKVLPDQRVAAVQSPSRVRLFATRWTTARQASLSITISWSSLKLMSIESVMPSNDLILCSPPTLSFPQHQGLFQWVSSSHQVAKVLELQLQHQSFQWIFRVHFL